MRIFARFDAAGIPIGIYSEDIHGPLKIADPTWKAPLIDLPDWTPPKIPDPNWSPPQIPDPNWSPPKIPDPAWKQPANDPSATAPLIDDPNAVQPLVDDPTAKAPLIDDPNAVCPRIPDGSARPPIIDNPACAIPINDPDVIEITEAERSEYTQHYRGARKRDPITGAPAVVAQIHSVAELRGVIKNEARLRILAQIPDWKQANLNAQASVVLLELIQSLLTDLGKTIPPAIQAKLDPLLAQWAEVKTIRDKSNVLETDVAALDDPSRAVFNPRDDKVWQ